MAGSVHVGGELRSNPPTPHDQQLQGTLIIGTPWWRPRRGLLGFDRVRFPFTFMGLLALGLGLWVLVYLAGHRGLDPGSQGIAAATVVLAWGLAAYVLIRRIRRGPQH